MSFRKAEKRHHVDVDGQQMSSTDMRMMMTFFLLRKMPKTPSVNRMALTVR